MRDNAYQYVLELFKDDGAWLGRVSVEVDWVPAIEWTRLWAMRRGELPLDAFTAAASIRPLWDAEVGEPRVAGFEVVISANGGREASAEFRTTYFRSLAAKASAHFVEQGALAEGELFRFAATAYPRHRRSSGSDGRGTEVNPRLRILTSSLADHLARAVPTGTIEAQDMPVLLPRRVLEEAEQLTRAHPGVETGGVLIGQLHHDPGLPEIFAHVSTQIPIAGPAELTRLSFTPDAWSAVQAAIELRNRQEIHLGYWHSHPVRNWCCQKECTPEKLSACTLARDYFSAEDRALLRTVFPRAYSLGLVVNDAPLGELSFSLFGWRRGLIALRGYYLVEDDDA